MYRTRVLMVLKKKWRKERRDEKEVICVGKKNTLKVKVVVKK